MDILSKLPFFRKANGDPEVAIAEIDEVQAKRDRIKFHRERVRNGPAKFKQPTNGQLRRENVRALNRRTKKARRSQVRSYFANQGLAASVRGHLQASGVLPFVSNRAIDPHQQVVSTAWLVQRFGTEIEGEDGLSTGQVSFKHDDVLIALGQALQFYGQIVGLPDLQVPADFIVPVYEKEDIAIFDETSRNSA